MHDHVDLMRICRAADTHGVDMTMQILGRSGGIFRNGLGIASLRP
jgi:hypothetical protein